MLSNWKWVFISIQLEASFKLIQSFLIALLIVQKQRGVNIRVHLCTISNICYSNKYPVGHYDMQPRIFACTEDQIVTPSLFLEFQFSLILNFNIFLTFTVSSYCSCSLSYYRILLSSLLSWDGLLLLPTGSRRTSSMTFGSSS